MTAALGMASFSMCGLYCNHADLSPRYAPFLLGMTNTVGALPGIVGEIFPQCCSGPSLFLESAALQTGWTRNCAPWALAAVRQLIRPSFNCLMCSSLMLLNNPLGIAFLLKWHLWPDHRRL